METARGKQWRVFESPISQMWKRVDVLILFLSCFCLVSWAQPSGSSDDMQIRYQTYHIDTKSITHPFTSFSIQDVVKYHGLYFCLFKEEPLDSYRFKDYSHILVIHPEDFSFSEVDKPEDVVFSNYSQILVRNDSILIKSYYKDEKDYCIIDSVSNESGDICWTLKEASPLSSVVYEDNDYKIVFTDKGEWGQYLSFIGQSDNVEHIYRSGGQVFKKPDGFYICNGTSIGRITNPKEGIVHEHGSSYMDAKASRPETLFFYDSPHFIYRPDKDTLMNAFFMHDDTIYMFETDKDGTYLSKFDGQRIMRLSQLKQRYEHIGYPRWGNNCKGDGGLFYCLQNLDDENGNFGLIDIEKNLVNIISIVTNQSPSISFTGNDGLKETLSFITDEFSSKTIDDADVLESRLGSHRNTIPHHLMYKSRYKSESRTFYRFVDDSIFVSAEYGYDSQTGLLNSLFLEWRPSSELSGSRYNYKKTPFPKDLIRQKVIATINETLPCKPKKKDGDSYIWTLNGVKIDLWNSHSGIRLLIERTK